MSNLQPLEDVGCTSETQLQVAENLNNFVNKGLKHISKYSVSLTSMFQTKLGFY